MWTHARVFSIWYYVPDPMMIILICPALTFKDSQYDHLLCWSVTAHSSCGQSLGLELVTQPCNNHMIYQTQWILRNQWDYLCPYSVSGRFLVLQGISLHFYLIQSHSLKFRIWFKSIKWIVPVLEADWSTAFSVILVIIHIYFLLAFIFIISVIF